jgi:hypothetical protein
VLVKKVKQNDVRQVKIFVFDLFSCQKCIGVWRLWGWIALVGFLESGDFYVS